MAPLMPCGVSWSTHEGAVESPLVQLDATGSAVDLGAAGVGPAVSDVEAQGTLIAVEDPKAGGDEAASSKAVEHGGVQLSPDAAPPTVRIQVERVQVAQGGIGAVDGDQGRPGRGEPDDCVRDGRHDDARARLLGRECVGPEPFAIGYGQAGEDIVGHHAPGGGTPGCDVHGRWRGRRPASRSGARPCPDGPAAVSAGQQTGAGDGNRTRVASLEDWGSTIELRPHVPAGTT
jgi:hypothetical protein